MFHRGKLVIGLILSAALLAAAVAWWYQFQQGHRILELWGSPAAYRIRMADQCELFELTGATNPDSPELVIGSQVFGIRNTKSLANAPGFVHARQALIQDASYDWSRPPPPTPIDATWRWAIRFHDGQATTTLLFDLQRGIVYDPEQEVAANIAPISDGLKTFLNEQLGDDT